MLQLSNNQIYDVYEKAMQQKLDHRDKKTVRDFARAIMREAMEWKNIESAPRDGKHFLCLVDGAYFEVAYFETLNGHEFLRDKNGFVLRGAEKWLPIPSPSSANRCDKCGLIDGCSVGCGDD